MLETMANIRILASSEEIANVIFAVVVAIFAIVGAVAKKNKEQKAEAEAQARREAARQRRLEQAVHDKQDDDEEGWIVLNNDESTPPPPPGPQRIGGQREPKPLRPPAPVIEGRQNTQRARAEARRAEAQARRAQAEAARAKAHAAQQKRAAPPDLTPHMPHRSTPATTSVPAASSDSEVGIRVNLTRARTARNAVILHEILGPPKALQDNPDPWQSA